MTQIKKQRILLLYKAMIPSTRLCGHSQLEHLAEQGAIEYRPRPVMRVSCEDLDWAEIVLMCRLDNAYEYRLAQRLKQAGRRLIYIIDDDLLNVPAGLTSGKYYRQKKTRASIQGLIGLSDAIVSPSPVLLAKYAVDGRQGILLEEPAIDPLPYAPRNPDRPVRIGFAGSVDRTGDIEQILRDVLLRIHNEYGERVEFAFFGAVPSFAEKLNARCVPYCDSYDAYRKTLNELQLDIGLAPMPDTPFHACKHYNKFIEYAAAGIVGVFSDVKPYDRIRTNFGWTLLCPNDAEAWYGMIKPLLDQPEELDQLKQKVAALAAGPFSIPVIAGDLAGALAELPSGSPASLLKLSKMRLNLMKAAALMQRAWDCLCRYGFKAPAILMRKAMNILKR